MWVRGVGSPSAGDLVLVTDDTTGQNRAALAAVRALARGGYRPAVSASGPRSIAAASRFCERRVSLPRAGTPGYADALRAELETGRYVAALPASDLALLAIASPSAALADKTVAYERAVKADIPTLPWHIASSASELRAAADILQYPLVVKAMVKTVTADPQASVIDSPRDLEQLRVPSAVIVQPYAQDTLRAVSGVFWDGRFLALSHQRYLRLWPVRAGVGSAAVTVTPDCDLEEKIAMLLKGHNGVFQTQFAGPYLLDVNPRVFGSLPLTAAAGANLPTIACDAAQGRVRALARARPGIKYRWLEGDLRHQIAVWRSGQISAAEAVLRLTPDRGAAHSTESLLDPLPALERLKYAAARATWAPSGPGRPRT